MTAIALPLVLTGMGLLAGLEALAPFRSGGSWRQVHLAANLGLSAATLAFNVALGLLLVADRRPPSLLELAAGVAALDFATYLAHLLLHAVPALWRVHRVHHSDPLVDVTTAYRQHPLETLWRFGFVAGPALALGLPAATVAAYRLLSALNALLEHANLRLWQPLDGALSLALVTPQMHKVHHSRRQAETDSNYGNILALFDRAFGTFTPSARAGGVEYGLEGSDTAAAQRLGPLLRLPWRGPA
jgi:sterol desaturase/sphingolipid hydroxylase (fatty acid hydroxylase superfamily)